MENKQEDTFIWEGKKYRRATVDEVAEYQRLIGEVTEDIKKLFQLGISLFHSRDHVFAEKGISRLEEYPTLKGCKTIKTHWSVNNFDFGTEI
ncbi:hypothetical protein [Bacterioplanoides sp.]|uniref:hypothetical protein n=1 Tax=Bacterioplanoides sp. TaxID=2066072 RepID=UPI003B5B480A